MSILSDREIKELCEVKAFSISSELGVTYFNKDNYKEKLANFYDTNIVDGFVTDCIRTLEPGAGLNICKGRNLETVTIKRLDEPTKPMISPFVDRQVRNKDDKKILSFGLSSAGYDVRLSDMFRIFTNIHNVVIDPLDFDEKSLVDYNGDYVIIPPNSYILGKTVEFFDIPKDIMVVCVGKSTYARCGAIVNVTPIEPGFKGNIVIEISNSTSLPLKIYANQGISQFLFFKMKSDCEVSYADRNGKYQNQTTIKTAIG